MVVPLSLLQQAGKGERAAVPFGISNNRDIVMAERAFVAALTRPVLTKYSTLPTIFAGLDAHGLSRNLGAKTGADREFLYEARLDLVKGYVRHYADIEDFTQTYHRSRELRREEAGITPEGVLELANRIVVDIGIQGAHFHAEKEGNRIVGDSESTRKLVQMLTGIKIEEIPPMLLEVGGSADSPVIKRIWGFGFGKDAADALTMYPIIAEALFNRIGNMFLDTSLTIITSHNSAIAKRTDDDLGVFGVTCLEIPYSLRNAADFAIAMLKDDTPYPDSATSAEIAYHAPLRRTRFSGDEMALGRIQAERLLAESRASNDDDQSLISGVESVYTRLASYLPQDFDGNASD